MPQKVLKVYPAGGFEEAACACSLAVLCNINFSLVFASYEIGANSASEGFPSEADLDALYRATLGR